MGAVCRIRAGESCLRCPLPCSTSTLKNAQQSKRPTDQLSKNVGIEISYLVYAFFLDIQIIEGKNVQARCTRPEPDCVFVFVFVFVCVCVCVCVSCVCVVIYKIAHNNRAIRPCQPSHSMPLALILPRGGSMILVCVCGCVGVCIY